ncbi:hypothetical protein PV08_04847 [Exophiala spinifera]|uniref:Saccharopine dehydrogenase NADP binding domain-containing protein n=1 Tax=Exophiala spinifera TaxID=91928 RepID=A0A0D1ZYC9_9EURO|nr:uncharacterized protein PV08_04847 [Exophiala spinifera]KIW17652.1 hypothetical protein PV08_04847 [Exophiala spinifera]
MASSRQYDIVLLGATGFTAGFVAEYIAMNLPIDLRWAVAGRDTKKLESLRGKLFDLNPGRSKPGIEQTNVKIDDVSTLASRTKVLINAIGPYTCYGEAVLSACAMSGTSYVDFCTETPWLEEMISKYSDIAKQTSARIIPAIGNSSSPSSIVAYLLSVQYRKMHDRPVEDIRCSYELKINGISAGSLSSILEVVTHYGISPLLFPDPYRLCSTSKKPRSPTTRKPFLGHCKDERLGHLATSFGAPGNEAVVYRSQHLQPSVYGDRVSYHEFMPASSAFQAIMIHVFTRFMIILLCFGPVRALIGYLKPAPGTGPSKEVSQGEKIEVIAVTKNERDLLAKYSFHGPMYFHSALLAAEAAMALLDLWGADEQDRAGEDGERQYGILTPSCLGMPFVSKLKKAGVKIEVYTS